MPLPFDHVTLINLYIFNYRGHRNYVYPLKCLGCLDLFQIFCDKKIQQIFQERDALVVVDLLVETCICTLNKLIKSLH